MIIKSSQSEVQISQADLAIQIVKLMDFVFNSLESDGKFFPSDIALLLKKFEDSNQYDNFLNYISENLNQKQKYRLLEELLLLEDKDTFIRQGFVCKYIRSLFENVCGGLKAVVTEVMDDYYENQVTSKKKKKEKLNLQISSELLTDMITKVFKELSNPNTYSVYFALNSILNGCKQRQDFTVSEMKAAMISTLNLEVFHSLFGVLTERILRSVSKDNSQDEETKVDKEAYAKFVAITGTCLSKICTNLCSLMISGEIELYVLPTKEEIVKLVLQKEEFVKLIGLLEKKFDDYMNFWSVEQKKYLPPPTVDAPIRMDLLRVLVELRKEKLTLISEKKEDKNLGSSGEQPISPRSHEDDREAQPLPKRRGSVHARIITDNMSFFSGNGSPPKHSTPNPMLAQVKSPRPPSGSDPVRPTRASSGPDPLRPLTPYAYISAEQLKSSRSTSPPPATSSSSPTPSAPRKY